VEIVESRPGIIKLSDNTTLTLKITIIDAREVGFSPFGGVHIAVKAVGGISTKNVPHELREKVSDKPLATSQIPKDGWELIDIREQEEACEKVKIDTSRGKFLVNVRAEATMAARNMQYKNEFNEPIYMLSWVYKVSWRPVRE